MIETLLEQVSDGTSLAPLLGFAVGVLLSLSPISLPSVPVVMSVVSPGHLAANGSRQRPQLLAAVPAVVAFVVGMDGVLGLLGLMFVELTIFFTRGAVAFHIVAAMLLGSLGLRLLFRRASLCSQTRTLPRRPAPALGAGLLFAVTGCPACGPIAIGVGAAAAIVGGPLLGFAILAAFVARRAAVLLATAALGARLLPTDTTVVPWRRLDLVVGLLFVVAAAYYLYRVVHGDVSTRLPGEPGSDLLP